MKILNIIDEDMINYKKTSMFIAFPFCSMKCNTDCGENVCQNSTLFDNLQLNSINISRDELIERYKNNPITRAVVFGGLEPFDSPFDLISFVDEFRNKYKCNDDIVIYTGYTEDELEGKTTYSYSSGVLQKVAVDIFKNLKNYDNIIVKFGRFVPNSTPHFDDVLGVTLASSNQYAKII